MTWRTILLSSDSKISLRLNHLVVQQADQVVTVPLREIGNIVVENPNIVMTGHILNALSENKITTIFCDNRHMPQPKLNLIYGHHRQVKTIREQIKWVPLNKDVLWREIIKQKIYNQKHLLKKYYHPKELNKFDIYIEDVELADETNREGHAAKVYFNMLFGLQFIRGDDDPINWALNYGYSLLLSLFTRIIITKGLLTEIGIHHRNQYNHYNLASDFMEVYRPLIDIIVKENIKDEFSRRERHKLLKIFELKVKINNRNQYLANSVEIYTDSLIRFMRTGKEKHISFPKFEF